VGVCSGGRNDYSFSLVAAWNLRMRGTQQNSARIAEQAGTERHGDSDVRQPDALGIEIATLVHYQPAIIMR
jgi:hypothetical protein